MQPDTTNQEGPNLTPEQAKASLGLATRLSEQMMGVDPSIHAQEGQGEEMDMETEEEAMATEGADVAQVDAKLQQGLEDLRNELHATIKSEVSSIKEMIKEALNEEGETEENS